MELPGGGPEPRANPSCHDYRVFHHTTTLDFEILMKVL
jgi:hypothetical protein